MSAPLSDREVQVLELVAAGKSNKEIGAALEISGFTVKNHLARISRKLDTGDRAGMVGKAFRMGVLQ